MVRAEARADVRELLRRRVVHRELPSRAIHREQLRRRMRRALLAERRIVGRTHGGGDPHATLLIDHRVVDVRLTGPQHGVAPVSRRRTGGRTGGDRRRGVAHGERHACHGVVHGIEHGQVVGAQLQRAVEQTVRVDARVAPVGRDDVVQVGLRIGPVPLGDDDVALDALRPTRRLRHLPGRDAVGPVGELLEHALVAELADGAHHLCAGLARLHAALPLREARRQRLERRRDLARPLAAELVAGHARARLDRAHPVGLRLHVGGDSVALKSGARELALVGHLQQREPVAGRIVCGGGARIGRGHGLEIHRASHGARRLRRVHEAVAAHPHAVVGLRQVRDEIAALVVGHDDAHELRRQIAGLGDHPHASLGTIRSGDDAADIVGADLRLSAGVRKRGGREQHDARRKRREDAEASD